MANQISNVSFVPTDYSAESQGIARRRQLAQQLTQEGNTPLGATEMVGGWAIPRSSLEGLAKVLKSYSGRKQDEAATAEEKALGQRYQTDLATTLENAQRLGAGTPAVPSTMYEDAAGNAAPTDARPAVAPDKAAMIRALMGHPATQGAANAAILKELTDKPESAFGKVDAKDYTPESVKLFAASGAKDFSVLVPVRKKEIANLGGSSQVVDPYAAVPGSTLAHTIKPDTAFTHGTVSAGTQATLAQQQQHWQNLSAAQKRGFELEAARLGISAQELALNRAKATFELPPGYVPGGSAGVPGMGGGGSGAPRPAMAPAPMAGPGIAPQPGMQPAQAGMPPHAPPMAPGMSPKAAQDIAVAGAKNMQEMQNKRQFNMGGINSALDTAEGILKGTATGTSPTSSLVGSAMDTAAGWVGAAPAGSEEADQLRAIGGALTSKVPRMEGPQSDKDVQLYREMAGQIGNDALPISRRLAALSTVRQLYGKYEHLNQPNGAQPTAPANHDAEKAEANKAILNGANPAQVRARFKERTGQNL